MYTQIERLLFACRFALVPMALGLSFGILLVLYRFFEQIIEIIGDLIAKAPMTDTEFLVDLLTLVDFFLIAGLLTMVMIAGYENFVARTRLGERPEMPTWIGRLSYHDLKLNLSQTIVAISLFILLQAFLSLVEEGAETSARTLEVLPWMIGLHITFVFSALALAVINRLGKHDSQKQIQDQHRNAP